MKIKTFFLVILTFLYSITLVYAGENDFPGREKWFDIKTIEIQDLKNNFNRYHVIDARSHYEYSTLHIKDAINIPLHSSNFIRKIKKLLKKKKKPLVFYCNGHTCFKSYKAAEKARKYGIKNVVAFDAGVFDWAKAYPDQAVLLGKSPVDPAKLISKKDFKKKLISPDRFVDLLPKSQAVLDIRDDQQRGEISLFPFNNEHVISMDKTAELTKFLSHIKKSRKPLLIYDEAGKQVRWLQYRLEELGVKNYFFMQGGAKAFFDYMQTH